jgi:hypothetical protein
MALEPIKPVDLVLGRLKGVKECGPGQWMARCPVHGDKRPSLSVGVADSGRVLLHCFSCCPFEEILAVLELSPRDLVPRREQRTNGQTKVNQGDMLNAFQRSRLHGNTKESRQPTTPFANRSEEHRPKTKFEPLAQKYAEAISEVQLQELAGELGLPTKALSALDVGWCEESRAYSLPERDTNRRVVGIGLRSLDGNKWMVTGSNRGLYLPDGWRERKGPILIGEGASCTAALTAMGLAGIGRPNAGGGAKQLAELLCDIPKKRMIIVLGENDAKSTGDWPGRDGAIVVTTELITALGRQVRWALPPDGFKDVREWLQNQKGQ